MPKGILPQTFVRGFHDEESVKSIEYREVPHLGYVPPPDSRIISS